MSDHAMSAWVFGKLPTHGDFVSRGLDQVTRDRLDHWLSQAMLRARDALGERFEAAYDAAPPWRFVEQDAERWTGGALCASVDAAGRRFPLMVGRGAPDPGTATSAAFACEEAIFQTFGEGGSVDRLMELASAEDAVPESPPAQGWWTDGNDTFAAARAAPGRDAELIVTMLQGQLDG